MGYYKLDMKRMPVRLLWQWGYRGKLVVFLLRRAWPAPWYASLLVPDGQAVRPLTIAQVDPALAQALAPAVSELAVLGYWSVLYDAATIGPIHGLSHAMLSADGTSLVQCLVARGRGRQRSTVACVSSTSEGGLVATGSTTTPLPAPPGVDALDLPGASPSVVVQRHAGRLAGRGLQTLSADDVLPFIADLQARNRRHHLSMGLYVPATDSDVMAALART